MLTGTRLSSITRALFIMSLFLSSAFAQSGNISGTVTDSSKRDVLVGAQVQVDGQPFSTSTDNSGRYVLLGVPAGMTKVTVSYLGLDSSTQGLNVAAGATANLDFSLSLHGRVEQITVTDEPSLVGQ